MAPDADNLVVGGATADIGGDVGYIKGGITQTPTIDTFTVDGIEQLDVDPEMWITHRSFELTLTLCEPTLDNIIIGWDLPDTTTSGTGTPPSTELDIIGTTGDFDPAEREIAVTGIVPGTDRYTRTVTWYKCVLTGPAPITFTKSEDTSLELTFTCLYEHTTNNAVGKFSDAAA